MEGIKLSYHAIAIYTTLIILLFHLHITWYSYDHTSCHKMVSEPLSSKLHSRMEDKKKIRESWGQ